MTAKSEYGFQLVQDRAPENRYLGELDADGYVIRLHELAAGDGLRPRPAGHRLAR